MFLLIIPKGGCGHGLPPVMRMNLSCQSIPVYNVMMRMALWELFT